MKKILKLCAAGAVIIAAAVACNNKSAKVTAAVAGPEAAPVALVVEYDSPIAPDAVTPETFAVPGYEIACVKVTDKNPAAKPECKEGAGPKGPKPECCGEGDPKGPKPECCGEGDPKGPKPECCGEGDPKPEYCEELPVPEIAVQQVADIVTADGKVVKAWKKAVNATAAVPFITKHGRHGAPGPKPGEPGCCKEEAPAAE